MCCKCCCYWCVFGCRRETTVMALSLTTVMVAVTLMKKMKTATDQARTTTTTTTTRRRCWSRRNMRNQSTTPTRLLHSRKKVPPIFSVVWDVSPQSVTESSFVACQQQWSLLQCCVVVDRDDADRGVAAAAVCWLQQ